MVLSYSSEIVDDFFGLEGSGFSDVGTFSVYSELR